MFDNYIAKGMPTKKPIFFSLVLYKALSEK